MERASAFSLAQDRASTPGLEMGAREMKQAVDHFLQNPIALSILAGLGAEQQGLAEGEGQLSAAQALAFAMGVVASILAKQNKLERSGAETAYSPSVLDALAQVGLRTPTGRAWVETNAVVAGRPFDQIALDWAKPPEVLLVEKKIEQIKGLAEAGRFDVLDPQFGADAAFLPYTGLWAKVGPEIQAQITSMQAQWAELAQYWGAVIAGGRPAGPPPPDSWGVGEIAMEKLEAAVAADLAQMKAELESGTAAKESMAAHLERLDQRKEMLGTDKLDALVAEVFGEKAAEVQGWLDFREEFLKGKAEYWHITIEEGKEAADAWDKKSYQPLREKRDQGLQGEYAALVGAIQAEAESLHNAYQHLYDAKAGWWQAYREGQPTREWEQRSETAREQLAELDPQGTQWWGAERDWAIDRDQRTLVAQFEQAHTAYWQALVHGDAAGLSAAKAQLEHLEIYHMSPNAEPIRRIEEAYKPQVEAAYLRELAAVDRVGSPAVLEHHLSQIAMQEQEMGVDWVASLHRGGPSSERAATEPSASYLAIEGQARSAQELAAKFDQLGWTEMKQWANLIWEMSETHKVQAEVIAAIMKQESGGDPDAQAGRNAGQGLMQVEFSAWSDRIPSGRADRQREWTDDQKREWILTPENNLDFAVGHIWKNTVTKQGDEPLADVSRDELRRYFQYYNYGSGAAEQVEESAARNGDWARAVREYGSADYGDKTYWHKVMSNYDQLMGRTVTYVPLLKQTDPEWSGIRVNPGFWKDQGCTLTSMAMMLKFHDPSRPISAGFMETLRDRVTNTGHDVVWYPKTSEYLREQGLQLHHESIRDQDEAVIMKRLVDHLDQGQPVILGLSGKPHWVVVTGYVGTDRENLSLSDFVINDPGEDRLTLHDLKSDERYMSSPYDALVTITRSQG